MARASLYECILAKRGLCARSERPRFVEQFSQAIVMSQSRASAWLFFSTILVLLVKVSTPK